MTNIKGHKFASMLLASPFSNYMQLSSSMPLFTYYHRTARMSLSTRSKYSIIHSSRNILPLERPPDPSSTPSNKTIESAMLLQKWMKNKTSILCLTGAGISTESGITDYRGHKGSYFNGHKPIVHHEFMTSESARKRYWARSIVGYSPFATAQPNTGHIALSKLEEMGWIGVNVMYNNQNKVLSTITQNVDTLHSKGGLKYVLHLHGKGNVVRCMGCGIIKDRNKYHDELLEWNQQWIENLQRTEKDKPDVSQLRPDGDAELGIDSYDDFRLPGCSICDESVIKTDVVFFGDSIPRDTVELATAAVDSSDGLLCIGTSLAVHSAFRLAKRAVERGIPIAILNVGKTRAEKEELEVLKIESPIGETLTELVKILDVPK